MNNQEILRSYKNVFDKPTIKSIWEMITQRKFEGLESPIKIGKESNVFSALTKSNERIAVKIYRINVSDFFQMSKYLSMDKRFPPIKRRMQIVLTWARREFINLKKAYGCGVSVPRPIGIKNNVLAMEFIGARFPEHPQAFPLLKDRCDNPKAMYEKVLDNIKRIYQKAGLVHGDLSEFNIINMDGEPVIIDFSHAIPSNNHSAEELLVRDMEKIVKFFKKKGLDLELDNELKKVKGAKGD